LSESDRVHWERVTESLVRLKDTSETMIDLAYSALLLNNRFLAQEVLNLEEAVDELHISFQLEVLSRTEEETDPKHLLGIIRMGNVTERIADAASEIAELVLRGIQPHPVLGLVIQGAEETVETAEVSPDSPVAGKTLREAGIAEETGMWVLYIRRGGRWLKPKPNTRLLPGDLVVASGYSEGEEDFKKLLGGG